MSSFVIAKEEYIKAAGFMAAIAATQNHFGGPVLRLWNSKERRLYTDEDFRRDARRLYEINVKAVAEQYRDDEPETDPDDYAAAFDAAKRQGAELMRKGYQLENMRQHNHLQRAIYSTINFFDSARCQIEGDEYTRRALMVMNKYYRGMYDILRKLDHIPSEDINSWGRFEALEGDD